MRPFSLLATLALTGAVAFWPGRLRAQPYALTYFSTFCPTALPTGLNNLGTVVGNCSDGSKSFVGAAGSFTYFTGPPGLYQQNTTYASAVNDAGIVTGGYYTDLFQEEFDAYTFSGGSFTPITCASVGYPSSTCYGVSSLGINDYGEILSDLGYVYAAPYYGLIVNSTFEPIGDQSAYRPAGLNVNGVTVGQIFSFTKSGAIDPSGTGAVTTYSPPAVGQFNNVLVGISDDNMLLGTYYVPTSSDPNATGRPVYFIAKYHPDTGTGGNDINYLPTAFNEGAIESPASQSRFSFAAIADNDSIVGTDPSVPGNVITGVPAAFTNSIYVQVGLIKLQNLNQWMMTAGSEEAAQEKSGQNSGVILQFGSPVIRNGQFGATGYGKFISTTGMEMAVKSYAMGYSSTIKMLGEQNRLAILVATTNQFPSSFDQYTYRNHGKAWGTAISNINAFITQNALMGQVMAAGSMDIEPCYAPNYYMDPQGICVPADKGGIGETKQWEDGFRETALTAMLINDSGTDGLPPGTVDGWTGQDIVSVTEKSDGVLPQVYNRGGAKQWHDLSVDEYNRQMKSGAAPLGLNITGVLTEAKACQQHGCPAGTNQGSLAAWNQMSSNLDNDVRLSNNMAWYTDIGYAVK